MRKILLFFLITSSIVSCYKEKTDCTGNCIDITMKGRIFDATTNNGFSGAPVVIQWKYRRTCFLCIGAVKSVYSGKADRDGNFNFKVSIDTSLFEDYSLQVSTSDKDGYFSLFPYSIARFDPLMFQNINIAYYPKTNLTLRLHRTQSDVFEAFSVYHYFHHTDGSGKYTGQYAYIKSRQQPFGDTTIHVETAANIFTKIQRRKSYANGTFLEQTDSLVCTKNGNNVFDIYY